MASKNAKTQDVTIRFEAPSPDSENRKHLANAELQFGSGLLAGWTLKGFAVWEAHGDKGAFLSVTFPSRETTLEGGPRRFYDYLRTQGADAKRLMKLKAVIVKEYQAWAKQQAQSAETAPAA